VGVIGAALLLTAGGARALTVVEDFEFYASGPLGAYAGGAGFKGRWSTDATAPYVTNTLNLEYSAPGYEVTCLGTGLVAAISTKGTLSKRSLAAPLPGTSAGRTVWLSTLIRPTKNGRVGWHFNASGTDRTSAPAGFLVVGAGTSSSDFRKLADGVLTSTGVSPKVNITHLILGSVLLKDTGEATVSYWVNPADLTSTNTLGTPTLTFGATFSNTLGSAFVNIGIEAYSDPACGMDALRVSDGNGDADQAFLDVTRATPKALFGPVQFGSLADLTNRFAFVAAATNSDWTATDDGNYGEGGFLRSTSSATAHHIFVPDSDGAVGGGNDIFGDCTIDYDMRATGSFDRLVGAFFLGSTSTTRSQKHWMLNTSIGSETNYVRAFYDRGMETGGGSVEDAVTNALNCSDWRHVRLDVRRVNNFTQVEARQRIWNSAHDFRGPPVADTTITYVHSHLVDGEVGFSAFYQSGVASADIDNVAIYRYGGAPDWYVPKGTLISVR
jgi:hypothetical protein